MTERAIYLAGPVDRADDPHAWREDVKNRWPDQPFIDPVAQFGDYGEDAGEVVQWCLRMARQNPVLVGGLRTGPTVGTWFEVQEALTHGQPVAVYWTQDLSQFVLNHPYGIHVGATFQDCLDALGVDG